MDQTNRTLHYIEVIYFEKGQYKDRKHEHYPEEEAKQMFLRASNKFKDSGQHVILALREENHMLIKAVSFGV